MKGQAVMNIKLALGAIVGATIASVSAAHAADLPEPVLPTGDWTGFHAGLGVGYSGINQRLALDVDGFGDVFSFSGVGGEGPLFTFETGYDFQVSPSWVLGVFGDYTYSSAGTDISLNIPVGPGIQAGYSLNAKHNLTVGGRVGWLADADTLIYGLVGWTWTEFAGEFSGDAAGFIGNYDFDVDGLSVGAGIEARVTQNWSAKLEYRYTDYGRYSLISGVIGPADLDLYDDISIQTIRAVVSYRFGNSGGYVQPTADYEAPARSWTGLRIGAGGGYGHINHTLGVDLSSPVGGGNLFELSGITGEGGFFTVEAGYDHQFAGDFVGGIQFDYTGSSIATEIGVNIPNVGGPTPINAGYELEASDSFTVAGRLGYLVTPETLAYGLLGYTWTEMNGRLTGDAAGLLPNYSFDIDGITIGAGVETVITGNLTGKLEYRYTGYNAEEIFSFPINDLTNIGLNDDISVQTVRAVLSYKLPIFSQ